MGQLSNNHQTIYCDYQEFKGQIPQKCNRFVYSILELTYRLTDPILNKIRRFLPNLGTLDISPIILLLLIWFIEMCMKLYVAPIIF